MRVVQGATKFEILKKKIATGFAKAERGGVCIVISFAAKTPIFGKCNG